MSNQKEPNKVEWSIDVDILTTLQNMMLRLPVGAFGEMSGDSYLYLRQSVLQPDIKSEESK